MKVNVKRVYDPVEQDDGSRVLIDRLWPRGVSKENLRLDSWQKEIAPSSHLREWFKHDPDRWDEFKKRYFAELDGNPEVLEPLLQLLKSNNLTLLYSARDSEHNNAVALKEYLEAQLK